MDFSQVLLNFRAHNNLTQLEAGQIIGVAQSEMSDYERGKHKPTRKNEIVFTSKMSEYETAKRKEL